MLTQVGNLQEPHESRIVCLQALRDYMFSGDEQGTLCVWHWANWQEAEWRRVSRRRRSHKSGKGGASGNAAMEPLMVCLHVLSAHEGQITSLYPSFSGGSMMLFSVGIDALIKVSRGRCVGCVERGQCVCVCVCVCVCRCV